MTRTQNGFSTHESDTLHPTLFVNDVHGKLGG